ncbi:MAG: ice-binding family protein [Candidatus Nomurabacteria bacterium]|nr:ice-binding family protein [Candidatus Nomurabacteria bacterium]
MSILSASGVYAAGPSAINLGTSGNFVILSKTGISTTGTTSVVGDIGVSPAEATYITGFDLILPAASASSTSALITGKVYAPSYATPTPSVVSTAVSDMETAYTDGAGRSLSAITELGAGNIGGLTLAPGLYKWGTGVTIPTDVTLAGSANDVWIFVVAQNLDISSAKSIVLSGGAKASNIFWVVAGQTTIGTGATFNGNILDQTAIVLNTGAVLNGRALAQSAVTLDASSVTIPSGTSSNSDSNSNSNSSANTSNSINAGASITSSPSVTLALSAIGATEMLISNDAGFAGASWEAYATSKPWVLTSGDGVKTVYAKFRNATGDISSVVSNNVTVSTSGTSAGASNEPIQGCSLGNLYNTSTGALCINNAVPQGCSGGNIYSTSTGALCVNNSSSLVNKYNFGSTTLKLWSKGDAVMELQRFLNTKLNLNLVVDGKLGPKTIEVIKTWQTANGLVSDGLVGTKTKMMMNL